MTERRLVETCAGMSAVTLRAMFGTKPPMSRIGCKTGYAAAILAEMKVDRFDSALLRDADVGVVRFWQAVKGGHASSEVDDARSAPSPLAAWETARAAVRGGTCTGDEWAVWVAGARGGVGGWKGGHVRRPSVDGFIPSLPSLVDRLRRLEALDWSCIEVQHGMVGDFHPRSGDVVYCDGPYIGRAGYGKSDAPIDYAALASRCLAAGADLHVSEGTPIPGPFRWKDITDARTGQRRVSLTRSSAEWLGSLTQP